MGTTDYISHPTPRIVMATSLTETLSVHVPELKSPTVEDVLEDRISFLDPTTDFSAGASAGPSAAASIGPVDYIAVPPVDPFTI